MGCSGPQAEGAVRAGPWKEGRMCLRLHCVLRGVRTDEGNVKGPHRDTSEGSGPRDLRTATVVSINSSWWDQPTLQPLPVLHPVALGSSPAIC